VAHSFDFKSVLRSAGYSDLPRHDWTGTSSGERRADPAELNEGHHVAARPGVCAWRREPRPRRHLSRSRRSAVPPASNLDSGSNLRRSSQLHRRLGTPSRPGLRGPGAGSTLSYQDQTSGGARSSRATSGTSRTRSLLCALGLLGCQISSQRGRYPSRLPTF